IYLPVRDVIQFTEEQRKLLMRLVDSGVLLWMDWGRPGSGLASGTLGGPNLANPFFLPLDFTNAAPAKNSQAQHPLLEGLFRLSAASLGRPGLAEGLNLAPAAGYLGQPLSMVVPQPGAGGAAAIAAGRYGSGF